MKKGCPYQDFKHNLEFQSLNIQKPYACQVFIPFGLSCLDCGRYQLNVRSRAGIQIHRCALMEHWNAAIVTYATI